MLRQQPIIIGLCIGILATIIFVLLHVVKGIDFFKKQPPDLAQAITLILSCTGAVAGFDFGRVALLADRTQLGVFTEHQTTMVIGAVVLLWVSLQQIIKTFYAIIRRNTE